MKEMQAIVFKETGKWVKEKRPVPSIKSEDGILVKVLAASICGTDLHILSVPPGYEATPDIILGHEFVGEVIETGPKVKTFKPGDRLICDNNLQCGVCAPCREGNYNVCEHVEAMGVQIDGVFCEYVSIPESSAVKISKDVPLEKAIFAEPLNCVMGGVKKLKVIPGDTVLILGGGPIGMYFAGILKASGAGKVIVSEVSEFRAEYALKSGADRIINPTEENLYEEIMKETEGLGADIVIDAVGVLIEDAIKCVKPAGQVLLFGLNASSSQTICQTDITRKGITIMGSFIGCNTLRATAKLIESDLVNFDHLVTHRLPLDDFEIGLEAMRSGKAFEVILYPFDDIR